MELYLLNKDFERYALIHEASSIIWHKKYYEVGDFEIYIVATPDNVANLQIGNYVFREDDDAIGIIENITIQFDETSEVDMMLVTGRFTESIYDRRIVWQQTSISTKSVSKILRTIIQQNVTNPTISERKIPEVYLPTDYEFFERDEVLNVQYTGDNILTVIQDMCKSYGLGFKHEVVNNQFYFKVYKGIDRSYAQEENPHVIFSDEYDNLIQSEYTRVTSNFKNTALVAGEGEGQKRKTAVVGNNNSGLERRELYVDKRDASSEDEKLTTAQYNNILLESGKESLSEYILTEVFTGIARIDERYVYKVDVNLGDICTIENVEWGLYINSRIVGVIETEDENGYDIVFEFGS